MAITLSGTRIIINKETGKGENWDNAYTIDDIYNAGVGVVKRNSGIFSLYEFPSLSIRINYQTYVKFEDCVIFFSGMANEAELIYCYPRVSNLGYLRCGYCDANGKLSKGVTIFGDDTLPAGKKIFISYFYDSIVHGGTLTKTFFQNVTAYKANGCQVIGAGNETNLGDYLVAPYTLKNCNIVGCYFGMRSPQNGSVIENLFINGSQYYGAWLYGSRGVTLRNVTAYNNPTDIVNMNYGDWASMENTLLDCKFGTYNNIYSLGTPTSEKYCILNIKQTFNLKVFDKEGTPLNNAYVQLFDKNNTQIFAVYTDSCGAILEQEVLRIRDEVWRRPPNFTPVRTIIEYNPFKLIITYQNKQVYQSVFNITDKINLIISLTEDVLKISSLSFTHPTLAGNDGTITVQATGGLAPYQFSIDGGENWQSSGEFTGLPQGTYQIVVKDAEDTEVSGMEVELKAPQYYSDFIEATLTETALGAVLEEDEVLEGSISGDITLTS